MRAAASTPPLGCISCHLAMSDYRILPRPQQPYTLSDREAREVGYGRSISLGCGLSIVLFIVFVIVTAVMLAVINQADRRGDFVAPIMFFSFAIPISAVPLGFIGGYLINRSWRERQIKEIERQRTTESNKSADRFAEQDTNTANGLLVESSQCFARLPQLLHEAESFAALAEREFGEGVIDPFWDAVEGAVSSLIEFDSNVDNISSCAALYYSTLDGKQHNFPPFPIAASDLPDPTETMSRLRRIIRTGQNKENPEFANIWSRRREHQLTRGVLREGFRTLGDATENIAPEIARSLSNLQTVLSSNITEVIEEQYKTRQTINDFARGY
jgi:hypothetical protein